MYLLKWMDGGSVSESSLGRSKVRFLGHLRPWLNTISALLSPASHGIVSLEMWMLRWCYLKCWIPFEFHFTTSLVWSSWSLVILRLFASPEISLSNSNGWHKTTIPRSSIPLPNLASPIAEPRTSAVNLIDHLLTCHSSLLVRVFYFYAWLVWLALKSRTEPLQTVESWSLIRISFSFSLSLSWGEIILWKKNSDSNLKLHHLTPRQRNKKREEEEVE